ncbi:hypothetical protein HMF8227_01930 [Saliniradius amylolyticus]|uniref:DUF2789 domain-containing protein n=1 Tax=Saliniradius amylolyticus TaxID=2183582 RepID=A0A2S2E594_9ALTE|nr:DUF2789 domain-containing protein [Saliniradius amylolyticus]AWL12400.1 hypothetical protein HMF8227_01930 [Saliniradius amylolyticus]
MDTSKHNIKTLFAQLGLDDSDTGINRFLEQHRLAEKDSFLDASFWNEAQKSFLHEAIDDDSDWAEVVDELDARLRH